MKKIIILLLIFLTSYSYSQVEYKLGTKAVLSTKPDYRSPNSCVLRKKTVIKIIKRVKGNYWYAETDKCKGYISGQLINVDDRFEEINKIYFDSLSRQYDLEKRKKDSINKIKEYKKERVKLQSKYYKWYQESPNDSLTNKQIKSAINIKKELLRKETEAMYRRLDSIELDNKKRDSIKKLEYTSKKCQYTQNTIDQFTGKKRIRTDYYCLSGEKEPYSPSIEFVRNGNLKYIIFDSITDLGCASPYKTNRSKVIFKLMNGQKVTFYHFNDVDCSDSTKIYGKLTNSDIVKLKSSKIKAIRVSGTKYYHDFENIKFNDVFIKKLNCIK